METGNAKHAIHLIDLTADHYFGERQLWIIGGTTFGFVGAVMMGFLLRAEFFHASAASVPDLTASSILLLVPALAAMALPARRVTESLHLHPNPPSLSVRFGRRLTFALVQFYGSLSALRRCSPNFGSSAASRSP
jgi:hypothetical protein